MQFTYLAAPYSHSDSKVIEERIKIIKAFDAFLFDNYQYNTVSPLFKHYFHVTDCQEYWKDYSLSMLMKCERIVVLKLDGWQNSKGLAAELECARDTLIPIEYYSLKDGMFWNAGS